MPKTCESVSDELDNGHTNGFTFEPLIPRFATAVEFTAETIVDFDDDSPTSTEVRLEAVPFRGEKIVEKKTANEGEPTKITFDKPKLIKRTDVTTTNFPDRVSPGFDDASLCIVTGIPFSGLSISSPVTTTR